MLCPNPRGKTILQATKINVLHPRSVIPLTVYWRRTRNTLPSSRPSSAATSAHAQNKRSTDRHRLQVATVPKNVVGEWRSSLRRQKRRSLHQVHSAMSGKCPMPQETRSDAETDLASDSEEKHEEQRRSPTLRCTTFCINLA